MHTERLTTIAEWLEAGAKHERITFDMNSGIKLEDADLSDPESVSSCGSSCCIAGAAVQFFDPASVLARAKVESVFAVDDDDRNFTWGWVSEHGRSLLGLDERTAEMLFCPWRYSGEYETEYSDPAWAARTIRHLIATGEVDWNATREGGAA